LQEASEKNNNIGQWNQTSDSGSRFRFNLKALNGCAKRQFGSVTVRAVQWRNSG